MSDEKVERILQVFNAVGVTPLTIESQLLIVCPSGVTQAWEQALDSILGRSHVRDVIFSTPVQLSRALSVLKNKAIVLVDDDMRDGHRIFIRTALKDNPLLVSKGVRLFMTRPSYLTAPKESPTPDILIVDPKLFQ